MICKLVKKDGKTYINVNGESLDPVAFMTYCPDVKTFAEFREIGIQLYSFTVHVGDQGINEESGVYPFSKNIYIGESKYDFSAVEKTFQQIAPEGKSAYIFPRVYIDAPKWWEILNPNELCCDFRGDALKQSFASEKWRHDMWIVLKAFIDYVDSSVWKEAVIGYHIAFGGTEECVYQVQSGHIVDYSEVNRLNYCKWLTRKYQNVEIINMFWGTGFSSFEEVQIPRWIEREYCKNGVFRDFIKERYVIDYYEYANYLIADTVLYFCRKVKEYKQHNVLTGAFYGYLWSIYNQDKGHHDMMQLLESPDIDFIASTNGGSAPGYSWPFGSAVDSVNLHNKLWFAEGDVRTCKSSLLKENLPHVVPENSWYEGPAWIGPATMELSVSALKKAGARVLTGQTGIWWFDMFGGWFSSPEMMQVISRHNEWMQEQTYGPLHSEIAVIIDEAGYKLFGLKQPVLNDLINNQKAELAWIGAPYHIYLADDLANAEFKPEDYRLYIFLTCVQPSNKVRAAIEQKLKKSERTILWVYLEDIQNDSARSITDYRIQYQADSEPMQCGYEGVLFPGKPAPCARFSENDVENAYAIAFFKDTHEPCILWKNMKGYSSVYSLLPAIPAKLMSRIASLSKVHLYNQSGDVIFAGGRFIAIHAVSAGEKRIYFPCKLSKVADADTQSEMKINYNFIDFQMTQYETRVFKLFE
jgi:beta-galactosidase